MYVFILVFLLVLVLVIVLVVCFYLLDFCVLSLWLVDIDVDKCDDSLVCLLVSC